MRRFAQILILAVIIILIAPIFLPNKIDAEVEKVFDSPVGIIFEEFNNLNKFSEWEPWTSSDSLAKKEYFSPYRGQGAAYKWETSKEGNGELTITFVEEDKNLEYELKGLNLGDSTIMKVEFSPEGTSKTKVKWTIDSKKIGYFSRYYSYFSSKNLEEKLQIGLTNLEKSLKTSTLTPEQADALQPGQIKIEMFDGEKLLTVLNQTSLDPSEITTATEESFGLIYSYLIDYIKIPLKDIGHPVAYYEYVDLSTNKAKFYCGYPIKETVKMGEGMELHSIPAGEALVYIHKGSYSKLPEAMSKLKDYASQNKLSLNNSYWEEYLNDPESVKKETDFLTKIYIPIHK